MKKTTKPVKKPIKKVIKSISKKAKPTQVKPKSIQKKSEPKQKGEYIMRLEVSGAVYESQGDDLQQVILGLKPEKISSKAFFTLFHNGKSATLVSIIPRTKRICSNQMTAYFFGRRIMQLLKPIVEVA